MKKLSQTGFSVIEFALVLVVIVALGGIGYVVWHSHKPSSQSGTTTTTSSYVPPSTSTPAAPQVNSASDLNSAMQALNQTDVTAGNTDSSQLGTQASSF